MKTIFLVLLACLLWTSNLSAQTPFYEGKTVRIIVGFPPAVLMTSGRALWLLIGANTFRTLGLPAMDFEPLRPDAFL